MEARRCIISVNRGERGALMRLSSRVSLVWTQSIFFVPFNVSIRYLDTAILLYLPTTSSARETPRTHLRQRSTLRKCLRKTYPKQLTMGNVDRHEIHQVRTQESPLLRGHECSDVIFVRVLVGWTRPSRWTRIQINLGLCEFDMQLYC